jgi:tRNA nucleotidyltransferase (CCA-adding enzyme)
MLENIIEILKKIEDNGYNAYIVGGFVRDYYMGKISNDIDICTNALPDDIKKIFTDIVSFNPRYGSVTINYNNIKCEITTFRKDIEYENNRKPTHIEYVSTLEEDLKRRDFTVNTLCMNKNLEIIDIFNGRDDIDHKLIKTVGHTFNKIHEDSLRILRAIRFATVLNFNLDLELENAIIENKHLLKNLSYERKKEELDKIFNSDNNIYGIDLLIKLGLIEVLELDGLNNITIIPNSIGIWAQISLNGYHFTKEELNLIKDIKQLLLIDINDSYTLYSYDDEVIKIVCEIKNLDYNILLTKKNNLSIKSRKDIKIDFNIIKKILNIDDNIKIKQIYDNVEKAIIYGTINNEIDEIKQYILQQYNNQ